MSTHKDSAREFIRKTEERAWLEKHAGTLHSCESTRFRNEKKVQKLLEGVAKSPNPRKEMEYNILFARNLSEVQPKSMKGVSLQRGYNHENHLSQTPACVSALERLDAYDAEQRCAVGMNPSTILTEYRRKIIFHAMLDSGDVNEDRHVAQEKLATFIQDAYPELLEDTESTYYQGVPIAIPFKSTTRKNKKCKTHSKLEDVRTAEDFHPKWEEYDIMRHRWNYIRPQLRESLDKQILPDSNSSTVRVLNRSVPVSASYVEALFFEDGARNYIDRKGKQYSRSLSGTKLNSLDGSSSAYFTKPPSRETSISISHLVEHEEAPKPRLPRTLSIPYYSRGSPLPTTLNF